MGNTVDLLLLEKDSSILSALCIIEYWIRKSDFNKRCGRKGVDMLERFLFLLKTTRIVCSELKYVK